MKTLGDNISSVGTKLLLVTAGVVALGTAAVTTAANFEEAMSSVKALLSSILSSILCLFAPLVSGEISGF